MAVIEANPRVDVSVLNAHIRKRIEPIYRSSVIMGMLKSRGRIKYNIRSGKKFDWRVRFRVRELIPTDGDEYDVSFAATNTKKRAELPWRSYAMPERVTQFEQLTSTGPTETVIYNILEDVTNELTDDWNANFPKELFNDGNSTTSDKSKRIHGTESMFGDNGTLSNGYVEDPNDSYAGISTSLANYGGSWSAPSGEAWPLGSGDQEYCFFSPLILSSDTSKWSASTDNWTNNWREMVRFALTYLTKLQSSKIDVLLMDPELYRQAADSLDDKERLEVTQDHELVKLGFARLQFDGIPMVPDAHVPSNTAYGLNFDRMALYSLQSQLVETQRDTDITTGGSVRLLLTCYCNMMFESPAFFAKFISA